MQHGCSQSFFFCFKANKISHFNQAQDTTDIFPHTVITRDRYLGFMESSATALVKFLCVIGRNLVKIIMGKEKYSKEKRTIKKKKNTLDNLHASQSKAKH